LCGCCAFHYHLLHIINLIDFQHIHAANVYIATQYITNVYFPIFSFYHTSSRSESRYCTTNTFRHVTTDVISFSNTGFSRLKYYRHAEYYATEVATSKSLSYAVISPTPPLHYRLPWGHLEGQEYHTHTTATRHEVTRMPKNSQPHAHVIILIFR